MKKIKKIKKKYAGYISLKPINGVIHEPFHHIFGKETPINKNSFSKNYPGISMLCAVLRKLGLDPPNRKLKKSKNSIFPLAPASPGAPWGTICIKIPKKTGLSIPFQTVTNQPNKPKPTNLIRPNPTNPTRPTNPHPPTSPATQIQTKPPKPTKQTKLTNQPINRSTNQPFNQLLSVTSVKSVCQQSIKESINQSIYQLISNNCTTSINE